MAEFPDEMSFTLVKDEYAHYEIALFDKVKKVYVYCNWCDDVIAVFDYEEVMGLDKMELYKLILMEHRKV
ncbi:hypothetical protein M199_gp265 [Halogranum tailed virus 1]|uniref:Uncharacterized protein n=1 Tax=Halogranum tailed virus 1 TaxID=1273749 RepID=R4TGP3_9CAUD|nr:hypothetical protein M199_gp265 [Halogranum tailed virus 1]AGM11401.1 hypothetical protein HGTV1_99 [Halogranum tailed virus 1]